MASKQSLRGFCPVTSDRLALVQKLIAGKWKLLILCRLSEGTKRFCELQKQLTHISQPILAQQLKELEQDKIVHREVYKEIPPKVEYSLTKVGEGIVPILMDLYKWIINYNQYVNKKDTSADAAKGKADPTVVLNTVGCQCGDYCTCGDSCSCGTGT